jgi:sugar O-acyltransferase (sialic acid O-acetyltransferase NeuD family)
MKPIILIGGGGHCRAVIDVIEREGKYSISGILDKADKVGTSVGTYKITGVDDDIASLVNKKHEFLITIGQIESGTARRNIFMKLIELGAGIATVISPFSIISSESKIGEGTVVMHHAVINTGAKIGCNCIINSKALVEHDCEVHDHCHIATAAVINGDCRIECGCLIGSGSVILQGSNIASESIIGAGAVVTKSIITPGRVYVGNPAGLIK